MATWTTLPDASLEPGKPIRSIDGLALRDNPIAISEGAAGAPKIQTNGITDSAVTTAKLANSAVTTGKLASNEQMTTVNVLNATAGGTSGAVGVYAIRTTGQIPLTDNSTFAGSSFGRAGTWRVMTTWVNTLQSVQTYSGTYTVNLYASLCLRIS
jgi:hypothetical protein